MMSVVKTLLVVLCTASLRVYEREMMPEMLMTTEQRISVAETPFLLLDFE